MVEDDPVVSMVVRGQLEQLGLTVDVASTGRRALELADTHSYRWVLLDCVLPDIDGHTVFEHLRSLPPGQRPERIIATSGMSGGHLPGAMALAPVDAILVKPVNAHALRRALELDAPSKTSAVPHADPIFDPSTIETIRSMAGGDAFMDRVLQEFLADLADAHQTLSTAIGIQDFQDIARTAHRLRGAAATVGANHIEQRCTGLQEAAEQAQLGSIASHITHLASETRSVELALSDFYR